MHRRFCFRNLNQHEGLLRRGRGWLHNIKTGLTTLPGMGVNWVGLSLDMEQWQALVTTKKGLHAVFSSITPTME